MAKRKILITVLVVLGFLLIGLFGVYQVLSSPVDKTSSAEIEVVISNGMTTNDIAKLLVDKHLIRNSMFFKIYLKLNNVSSLKASTYIMKKSMDMPEIISILEKGNHYNPDAVTITFKEGKSFTSYAEEIAKHTNNSYDDVIKTVDNDTYIGELIDKYWFLTDEILNQNIYYALEGYLAPNTYQFKNKDVKVEEIFTVMLDQMAEELKDYQNVSKTYTMHEYLTLASMLELEGTNDKNRKMIAGVFYNRLQKNMNLGSDVTTYYALQSPMTSDLTTAQFNTQNPYNTRGPGMLGKLPVGPICSPSISSIKSSINPAENDYLYFVADKHGDIFYTKTNEEHLQKVQEIKDKGDWIW